ncbi:MAG: anhydro-N-acetylmuramic acid kinase [Chitinophagaceae bacterium]|nr:anhydro-N-acetylmuramic acid kinase [Chitinophagaceae bacterium]
MLQHIEQLYAISQKKERLIIGLMSGTSLDGLDVALCRCSGSGLHTSIKLLQFSTLPYPPSFKLRIKEVFSRKIADLELVCLLNGWVGVQHADMVKQCLEKWKLNPADIDLIASHGQTIYHAPLQLHGRQPYGNATLQIGDGDHLAVATGIITLSDFRQKHIAAGGEGAPLAAYGDYLIFGKPGENRIMLNIGGIANFTFLPASMDATKVFSTDTGTGNTMMDAWMQANFTNRYFDENAEIARQGKVHNGLLHALKTNAFFDKPFPKTIGPELFNLNYLQNALTIAGTPDCTVYDVMATLNAFSAETIIEAIQLATAGINDFTVYISGGGMHNPQLLKQIQAGLPGVTLLPTDVLGINPDAKEAVLFALLANECVAGNKQGPANAQQGIPAVSMGKISLPG